MTIIAQTPPSQQRAPASPVCRSQHSFAPPDWVRSLDGAGTVTDGVRLLRVAAFSCTATVLGLGSHLAVGGAPPTWWATAVACALAAGAGAALAGRRHGAVGIGVVLAAVQLCLHELFTASAAPATESGVRVLPFGQHVHCGAGTGTTGGDSAWMLLAHAAAVLATAAALNHGDTLIALLLVWLRPVRSIAGPARAEPLPRPAPGLPRTDPIMDRTVGLRACAAVVRRGPPVPAC
jgi:hypothetical protein